MKRTIASFIFIAACIAGIIFLLLPFLETTPPATTELKSVQPQITTSNPLAAVARRLASLFKHPSRERSPQLLSSRNSYGYPHPELIFAHPNETTRAAHTSPFPIASESSFSEEQQVSVLSVPTEEYGDASLLTDQGEWVLIRQTSPQQGASGMHEINVHENPYDRYVKQERARRYQPPTRHVDIPDSKWARLLRPIKELFGITNTQPVGNSTLSVYRDSSFSGGLASDKNHNISASRRLRSPWPDISPTQWANMSDAQRQLERERRSAAEFIEIMSGTRVAEDAAAIEAEAKYPDPKDQGKREEYQKRLTEENKQAIKAGLLAAIRANAEGKDNVDDLEHIMTGCTNAVLPKPSCNPDQPEIVGSLFSSDELAAWQEKSRQIFLEKTNYRMPDHLPILPVLGPTTPQTIANLVGSTGDVEKTNDLYTFLYDKNQCASQDCFLIPNSIQANEQLRDTLKLANMHLITDPDNLYPTYKEDFIRYKVEQAQKQQGQDPSAPFSEQQIRKQAEKQFTENAVNWLLVTPEQLKNIYDVHTLQAANPKNAGANIQVAVLYQTNPIYAEKMYHTIGDSPIFGYAKEPLASVEKQVQSIEQQDKEIVEHTADLTIDSISENVYTAFQEMKKITKHSASEGIRAGLNLGAQTNNDMRNAISHRNTQTNKGKK